MSPDRVDAALLDWAEVGPVATAVCDADPVVTSLPQGMQAASRRQDPHALQLKPRSPLRTPKCPHFSSRISMGQVLAERHYVWQVGFFDSSPSPRSSAANNNRQLIVQAQAAHSPWQNVRSERTAAFNAEWPRLVRVHFAAKSLKEPNEQVR